MFNEERQRTQYLLRYYFDAFGRLEQFLQEMEATAEAMGKTHNAELILSVVEKIKKEVIADVRGE